MMKPAWEFTFRAATALAAVLAALSYFTSLIGFYYFRRRIPKVELRISAKHELGEGVAHLFITVEAKNVDYVLVQSDRCTVSIRPWKDGILRSTDSTSVFALQGANDSYIQSPSNTLQTPETKEDVDRIWIIDKDET